MPYYAFGDDEISFYGVLHINIDDGDVVERLLDEYRETDECYDFEGWVDFLVSKGYDVSVIEVDREFYF